MRKIFIILLFGFSPTAFCQAPYWQQEVNYEIDVSLNDRDHSLTGQMKLNYRNQSPDTLNFIWFHLWPNAYRNNETAFARQVMQSKAGARLRKIKDKGYIDSLSFTSGNTTLKMEAHPEHIDIMKVWLAQPLLPGQSVDIATPFFVKLPSYNSRSGHSDDSYMVCQWYPKPAVYDRKGWHPMPYLDMGEFYSEFGSFRVNITLPGAYVVGATGVLQNEDEYNTYKKLGSANLPVKKNASYVNPQAVKTLRFSADSVHDFAWFADKDFIIEYDTLQLPSGRAVDVFTYHHPKGNRHWDNSVSYVKDAVNRYSAWVGEYPYPVVAAVEGPTNEMSGGMEYPMITLITSPGADEKALDAVITHEVGHNWFYGILASNERAHAWMDEGINSYYQFRYEAIKYRHNSVFGDRLPEQLKKKSDDEFLQVVYATLNNIPMPDPIDQPSTSFKDTESYGLTSYVKTSIWMYIIELYFNRELTDKAIQVYYQEWKFKHPYPEDMKASFEKTLGRDMDEFFDVLQKKGKL